MSDIAWIAHPLLLSVKALFCSFLLLISIGLAIAYFLAFSKAKFKKIVEILVIFPLIFPPIATGFLLLYIFGKSSKLAHTGFTNSGSPTKNAAITNEEKLKTMSKFNAEPINPLFPKT